MCLFCYCSGLDEPACFRQVKPSFSSYYLSLAKSQAVFPVGGNSISPLSAIPVRRVGESLEEHGLFKVRRPWTAINRKLFSFGNRQIAGVANATTGAKKAGYDHNNTEEYSWPTITVKIHNPCGNKQSTKPPPHNAAKPDCSADRFYFVLRLHVTNLLQVIS